MKTKSFKEYLKQRLDTTKIAEIKKQAKLEIKILTSLQQLLSNTMEDSMKKNLKTCLKQRNEI